MCLYTLLSACAFLHVFLTLLNLFLFKLMLLLVSIEV